MSEIKTRLDRWTENYLDNLESPQRCQWCGAKMTGKLSDHGTSCSWYREEKNEN